MHRRTGWGLVLAAGTLSAACSEPMAPPPLLVISIASAVTSAEWNSEAERYECRFTLTASADGGGAGASAEWQSSDGQWRYFNGNTEPFSLNRTDLLDIFGSPGISTGATQVANRLAWSVAEFDLAFTFKASLPDGSLSSTFVFVDCF